MVGSDGSDSAAAAVEIKILRPSSATASDDMPPLIVLSHWPHVATQVEQQVAAHVASVKAL